MGNVGEIPESVKQKYGLEKVQPGTELDSRTSADRETFASLPGTLRGKRTFYRSPDGRHTAIQVSRKQDGNLEPMFWILNRTGDNYENL